MLLDCKTDKNTDGDIKLAWQISGSFFLIQTDIWFAEIKLKCKKKLSNVGV